MGCQCTMQNNEYTTEEIITIEPELNYAGFLPRLVAFAIDNLLIAIVLLFVKIPLGIATLISGASMLTKPVLFEFSTLDIIFYLLGVLYFVIATYNTGTTFGKWLLKLKVVSSNNTKPSFLDLVYRETIGRYLSSIIFIGYIIIPFDSEKRGLHDRLCDTRVIYNLKTN